MSLAPPDSGSKEFCENYPPAHLDASSKELFTRAEP